MKPTLTANDLFSTPGRVSVLRALWSVEVPMNAAEVARRTRLTHPAATAVLRGLVGLGVVASAPAGRGSTFWINRQSIYVQRMIDPVFGAEQALPELLLESLRQAFEMRTVSAVLFGSYARGDQTPESDIDVIAVTDNGDAKQALEDVRGQISMQFRRQFGASLSLIVYTATEAAELPSRAHDLYESLTREGVRILGVGVDEWGGLAKK